MPGMLTTVAQGPLAGRTLPELLDADAEALLGRHLYARHGRHFPLLVKFIDARDDLSIQVHPHDEMAPGEGKTELWYIIDAEPGSKIYSGLNRKVDAADIARRLADRTLPDVLARHHAMAGDVFYLPAGRVHSIGAGNLLLEIQQPSDTTYRLWDFERRGLDGKLRPLHIDKALQAIDYDQTDYGLARPELLDGSETLVKRTPYFTVTALKVSGHQPVRLDIAATDSMRVLVAVDGQGTVTDAYGHKVAISRGQTVLVPAAARWVDIQADADAPLRLITAYIE